MLICYFQDIATSVLELTLVSVYLIRMEGQVCKKFVVVMLQFLVLHEATSRSRFSFPLMVRVSNFLLICYV